MRESPEQIVNRLYKLMVVGSSCDPELEEEIRRLKNKADRGSLHRETYTRKSTSSQSERMQAMHGFNRLLKITTGAKLKRGTKARMGQHINPAFRLPKKSGFIDSTLFWFWVDAVRKDSTHVRRGIFQYRIRTHEQIIDVWYDDRQEEYDQTEVFLTNFDRATGILHCHICDTDAYLGRKPELKWHCISFGEVGRKKGKFTFFIARPMEAVARFNIWQLARGHFSQCNDEAISEINTQLTFVHGRSRIHQEWSSCKEVRHEQPNHS